jgi:hypothetical protein
VLVCKLAPRVDPSADPRCRIEPARLHPPLHIQGQLSPQE